MKILDCTLRDGGYYTKWYFEEQFVAKYIAIIKNISVDIVELGYLNTDDDGNGDFYALTNTEIMRIKKELRKDQKVALMIDAKRYKSDSDFKMLEQRLVELAKIGSYLIRITTSPSDSELVYKIGKIVISQDHEYSINIMYLHRYVEEKEQLEKFIKTAKISSYVCLVDSYGACLPSQVRDLIQYAKSIFDCSVGFHGHNNMELVTANALAACEANVDALDSTFDGMGRGAGNLRTEAILAILKKFSKERSIDQYHLAQIEELMEDYKKKYNWGARFPYLYTGINKLPQADVMSLFEARRYSVLDIYNLINNNNINNSDYAFEKLSKSKLTVLIGNWDVGYQARQKVTQRINDGTELLIIGINAFNRAHKLLNKVAAQVSIVLECFDFLAHENQVTKYKFKYIYINNLNVVLNYKNILSFSTKRTKGNLLEIIERIIDEDNHVDIFGLSGIDSRGNRSESLMLETQAILKEVNLRNRIKLIGPTEYLT